MSYTPASQRMSHRSISRRKKQPNVALIISAFCLGIFVWGNHQIISPPSCGDGTVVTFMNIDTGQGELRPCEAGEQPVQPSIGEDLSKRLESVLVSAKSS